MGEASNIFICWSKPRGKAAALALHDWLPRVVQATKPWMSEKGIDKGTVWLDELLRALGGLKLGIVCLTPENLSEPWLLFETGVLSKALDRQTRIWTYLLGDLRQSDAPQPLGLFQHTVANEEDTFRLLESVNRAMDDRSVSPGILRRQFEMYWPELREKLSRLPAAGEAAPKRRDVEEMFAEILELVRAGAGAAEGFKVLREDVRVVGELVSRLYGRVPPSAERRNVLDYLVGGASRPATVTSAGYQGPVPVSAGVGLEEVLTAIGLAGTESAESTEAQRWARARLIEEIKKEKRKLENAEAELGMVGRADEAKEADDKSK